MKPSDSLPADLAAAHAMILAQREMLIEVQAHANLLASEAKIRVLEIERLKLMLAKMGGKNSGNRLNAANNSSSNSGLP